MKRSLVFARTFLIFSYIIIFGYNCAIFNRNNTPLIVQVEKHLVPEEPVPKIIAAPLYIPIGLLAGLLDLFLVHPIMRIPNAYQDTISILWTPRPENRYVTRMAFLPFSVLLTPVIFFGDLFFRSAFDVNGNVDRARIEEDPIKQVKPIQQALAENNRAAILKWLTSYSYSEPELSRSIIDKYPEDAEIRRLALQKLVGTLNDKTFPKFEDSLVGYLNKDPQSDRILLGVFRRLYSKKASEAILNLVRTRQVSKENAKDYILTILYIGSEKDVQFIVDQLSGVSENKKP
ncbi:hypothetical protein LEP1GSC047_3254 [Leptospira inadai serovar Lyme str. 10]|uniref:Uncharacterized protein n=2 Tax=Leptospira inadai serovar Lyme TaxID=293084 RepID=V6HAG6_9LEPT|nr:hypothetical protein [Leptospira inadai]EQA36386.1 hypothetical protein LEP1GSC047_3254 [Leptospira inadai serovar Lyme str. 10]PNV74529.1 hypothetical protein BES34_013395 [Leptospira inadai serovar Lyme]